MKRFVFGLFFVKLCFLLIVVYTASQTASLTSIENATTPTPEKSIDSLNRPVSEPYTGDLSIFEDERRAENLQIERVMDILKISKGKSVADIGAGSGWFTVRAAGRVGEKGKVFAVEINQEYINHISERAKNENFRNIQTVLGAADDPKLSKNSIDAVLILKTYHEIAEPVKLLKNLKESLRKNARIGIIDRSGSGDDHGIDREVVIEEAKSAGFVLVEEHDFVQADEMDYFLIFQAHTNQIKSRQ